MKYILISGGVVSGLGKGITSSSVGALLIESGLKVTSIKIDPYLNTDAGTMSPYEHGEVFVLDDGGEADLDLGNYERFLDVSLSRDHNITTGKVYSKVIEAERRGDYLGKTVQVVPHVTDEIQQWITEVAQKPVDGSNVRPDVCLIELGGTVGDIESMVFLEALRQFRFKVGSDNFCHIHVSLVPVVHAVGQQKTKPTQHSNQSLRHAGHLPDVIVCRSTTPLETEIRQKIALSCMVPASHVIGVHDVSNIYHVPLMLAKQRMIEIVMQRLRVNKMSPSSFPRWQNLSRRQDTASKLVRIAVVGKYTGMSDSYLSIIKALRHAALSHHLKLEIVWIESTHLQPQSREMNFSATGSSLPDTPTRSKKSDRHNLAWKKLKQSHGILIPGGFGSRGIEGKILAIQWARMNNVPFLGICLGMQMCVIEMARSKLGLEDANSTEMDKHCEQAVVIFMPEGSKTHMGGTMRLGSRKTIVRKGTLAAKIYDGATEIWERHRHRYEVNPKYIDSLEKAGLSFSGKDETGVRMEIVEIKDHPFFVGVQYHPEFKSRPFRAHPLFVHFVGASSIRKIDPSTALPTIPAKDGVAAKMTALKLEEALANPSPSK